MIGDSNDEINFSHKLLLIDTQVSKICKAFANGLSANIKLSKTQLAEIEESGGFILSMPIWGSCNLPFKGTLSSVKSVAK